MRPICALALVLLLVALGCTAEDKRQWHEALRELRADNMEFGAHSRQAPQNP